MNLCLPYTPCLIHPLWIVTWKVGFTSVSLHVCPSHVIFVPAPCLECVHASVHEFMSTWLLMSNSTPMYSLMETWVPLYGSVFVSQSSHFCCHTLVENVYMHQYMNLCLPYTPCLIHTPMDSYMESWVHQCVSACVSQSCYFCSYTLFRMCTCISTWIYVHLTAYVWSTRYA